MEVLLSTLGWIGECDSKYNSDCLQLQEAVLDVEEGCVWQRCSVIPRNWLVKWTRWDLNNH